MTLPQFHALAAYWKKFPPVHLLLRSFFVHNKYEKRTANLGELLADADEGGIFNGS